MFFDMEKYVFFKRVFNTLNIEITQMLKKFPSDKINGTEMSSFLFRELQLTTVLLLVCDSYLSWSTRFVPLKLFVEFLISIPFRFY